MYEIIIAGSVDLDSVDIQIKVTLIFLILDDANIKSFLHSGEFR